MDRYLAVLIGCPLAFLILWKRRAIREFVGDISFAERFLGMGGTNTFIVLLGIFLFIGSLMYGLGTLQSFLKATVGKLF